MQLPLPLLLLLVTIVLLAMPHPGSRKRAKCGCNCKCGGKKAGDKQGDGTKGSVNQVGDKRACGCQNGADKTQGFTQPDASATRPDLSVGRPDASAAQAETSSEAASDKLSQDENLQLKQALYLAEAVKSLNGQFDSIKSRLPETSQSEQPAELAQARRRELAIITEQLRIARSHSSDLMRFVMARFQTPAGGHVPSFSDASWALTAGHLSLSFARKRIVALG